MPFECRCKLSIMEGTLDCAMYSEGDAEHVQAWTGRSSRYSGPLRRTAATADAMAGNGAEHGGHDRRRSFRHAAADGGCHAWAAGDLWLDCGRGAGGLRRA